MAITYPLDLLDGFKGHSINFDLLWRQEQSRQANGRTIVKDMGTPLWQATYQSVPMYAEHLDYWKARLNVLENGLQIFIGRPISRLYPIDDPGGKKLGSVNSQVIAIESNRKELMIDDLPEDYKLSTGDFITIFSSGNPTLYQIGAGAVADSNGEAGFFEVRPHLAPEVSEGDEVQLIKPYCHMMIVPGTITSTADIASGIGAVSFQAIEAR